MSDNITDTLTELNVAFTEFKSTNDARLAEIEKRGSADTLLDEKLGRLNDQISELEKKNARPALNDGQADRDAHAKEFNTWARKGLEGELADLERKAMNITTGADGGFALPAVIDGNIYEIRKTQSPVRELASVVTISTNDYSKLVNRKGAASGWVDEDDARTATGTPKLAKIAIPMGEIYANPQVTQTALDDLSFDVEALLANDIAQEFAFQEAAAFVNGDGVNKPKGFLSYATTAAGAVDTMQHIASGTAGALPTSFDKFYTMVHSLKAGHRAGASWLANTLTCGTLRTVKDANGRYMWEASTQVGVPSTLLGYAIRECEDMPGFTANALPIAFANFKNAYLIADRFGIRTLRDPYSNKPNVGFYSTARVGGAVIDFEAIKVMKLSAS